MQQQPLQPINESRHDNTDLIVPPSSSFQAIHAPLLSSGNQNDEQHMFVLCGLVGSGKSTFARALIKYFPGWVRCNQDELGSRQAVEALARQTLESGQNVIIDRTNIDARQRRRWLQLAQGMGHSIVVSCLTFTIALDECERRLLARTDHETIHSPQDAIRILHTFRSEYQPATVDEGFHYAIAMDSYTISKDPSQNEIQAVLDATMQRETRANGKIPDTVPQPNRRNDQRPRGRGRGRGNMSGRGKGALYTPHSMSEKEPQHPFLGQSRPYPTVSTVSNINQQSREQWGLAAATAEAGKIASLQAGSVENNHHSSGHPPWYVNQPEGAIGQQPTSTPSLPPPQVSHHPDRLATHQNHELHI